MSREKIALEVAPSSRWPRLSRLLDIEHMHLLEILLDEAFVVPGTPIRFGLDGIFGLVPGLDDVLADSLSLVIPPGCMDSRRYLCDTAADGCKPGDRSAGRHHPVAGDAFDIWWKANRRNYLLLTRSVAEPHQHAWKDWLSLMLLATALDAIFALPVMLFLWLAVQLTHGVAHGQ